MRIALMILMVFTFFTAGFGQTEKYKIIQNRSIPKEERVKNRVNYEDTKRVKFGLRVGLSLNSITDSYSVGTGSSKTVGLGMAGGFVTTIRLKNNLHLQTELLMNPRGAASKSSNSGFKARYSARFYYLELPILIKGVFGPGNIKGIIATGPQFGYGLFTHETAKFSGGGQSQRESITSSYPDVFNRFQTSWAIDIGARAAFDNTTLEFTFRPQIGLNKLVDSSFANAKSRTISFLISMAVLMGK